MAAHVVSIPHCNNMVKMPVSFRPLKALCRRRPSRYLGQRCRKCDIVWFAPTYALDNADWRNGCRQGGRRKRANIVLAKPCLLASTGQESEVQRLGWGACRDHAGSGDAGEIGRWSSMKQWGWPALLDAAQWHPVLLETHGVGLVSAGTVDGCDGIQS